MSACDGGMAPALLSTREAVRLRGGRTSVKASLSEAATSKFTSAKAVRAIVGILGIAGPVGPSLRTGVLWQPG